MNCINNSNINWLNIIYNKQFQDYLNIYTIKELSLISKAVRFKLTPKLFYAIKIENNYQHVGRKRIENYNVRGLNRLNNLSRSGENESNKVLYAEKVQNDINSEFARIKEFIFNLYLDKLNNFAYLLTPIFESYINLKVLKLYYCTIPYSLLVNLGVSFPNLKAVELSGLLLVKLSTDVTDPCDLNFPPNLIYLKFGGAKIIEQEALSNPYEVLFKRVYYERLDIFKLPKIPIPSLKKLEFTLFYGIDEDLEEFLDLNTNLKSLKIRSINLERVYNFNSIKVLEVDSVYYTDDEPTLSIQEGIRELTAKIPYEDEFEKTRILCNLCPNLEKLQVIMPRTQYENNTQERLDNFLIPVLLKLPKLKTLVINIDTNQDDILDISQFPDIENIIFEIYNPNLNFEFNNCYNLKSIEIKCKLFELDNEKFIDEFNVMRRTYSNWNFKLVKGKIKGNKDYQ